MKNPPHMGEFVREEIIAPLGLSVTDAAKVLGVSRGNLSMLLNERISLSAEMALRLEKAFGVDMELILRMQSAYDIAQAKRRASTIKVARYRPKPEEPRP